MVSLPPTLGVGNSAKGGMTGLGHHLNQSQHNRLLVKTIYDNFPKMLGYQAAKIPYLTMKDQELIDSNTTILEVEENMLLTNTTCRRQ